MAEILVAAGAEADAERVAAAELEARRALHRALDEGHADTEPLVWKAYFAAIFRGAGVPEEGMEEAGRLLREVHAREHLWTGVAEGTGEALDGLSEAGYRLGVISNADGRVEGVLEEVGLRRHFEFVVDSELFGAVKPDPSIFREGCRLMDLPPEACVYVGDLYPVDYLGATRAGLAAVLLDPLGLHQGRAPRIEALGDLGVFLADGDPRRAAVSTHG